MSSHGLIEGTNHPTKIKILQFSQILLVPYNCWNLENLAHDQKSDTIFLKSIKSLQNKNLQVLFGWIPSHVGIIGNEIADQTAKTGSKSGKIRSIKLSIKEMYHIVEQKVKQTFKENILKTLQLKF